MKELNDEIIDKIAVLNELENQKSRIYVAIFKKKIDDIKNNKINELKNYFETQTKFYNQYIEDYTDIYNQIEEHYNNELSRFLEKYNEMFVNIYLELQETECNKMIAIANIKNSYNIKCEYKDDENVIEEYDKKIKACIRKKSNYEIIISECENELNNLIKNLDKQIDIFFVNKSNSLIIREENFIEKVLNKIKNIFIGKNNFINYVINPLNIELEVIEGKVSNNYTTLSKDILNFVAKIRQAKKETNKIFEQMI